MHQFLEYSFQLRQQLDSTDTSNRSPNRLNKHDKYNPFIKISKCKFSNRDPVSCVVNCTPESLFARLVSFTYSSSALCLPIDDIFRTNCILPPLSKRDP